MQQIINFVIKNSTRLLFLLLLGLGFFLTIQAHYYHKNLVVSTSNQVSGFMYEKKSQITSYFDLKNENQALVEENTYLKKILMNQKDSLLVNKNKMINNQIYELVTARIINNKYNSHYNYLTINAGSSKKVKEEMGVINSKGIIGVVTKTSSQYAKVKSILNLDSQINAKTKRSNHKGIITWNGKNTGYVQMLEMPRLSSVKVGDTIVTSNSLFFPEGINIGIIKDVYTDDKTSFYTLNIKLFNDMTNLGYVSVIKNYHKKEIESLEQ